MSNTYAIELRNAGATRNGYWLNQLLSLADAASTVGREDIAARLTCYGAEIAGTERHNLPQLNLTKGVGVHGYGLEDFTDVSTIYVCKGLLNRKALLGLPVPAVAFCQLAITALNEFFRQNQVERVVFYADGDAESVNEMKRLRAFVRIESRLWVAEKMTVREAVAAGLTARLIENATRDLRWTK